MFITLNENEFLFLFSGSEPCIMKFGTVPRFQQDLMIEQVKGNVVSEYWGVLIIRDRMNIFEGFIKQHIKMRGSMPCGKVQDKRYVTGMSRTIPKEDAATGIWLPAGKILTV